jgi:Tfp pilus assembly protein PilV
MFNAKAQRREGAKRKAEIAKAESRNALPLCVFASLRLCVETSSFSVKHEEEVTARRSLALPWRRGEIRNPQSAIRNYSGLTIIEMLVSTTLLVFIVLGLTAMFVQTQRAFKTGLRQSSMSDAGRTVIEMVTRDLSQVSDAQTPGITNLFWSGFTNEDTFQYQDSPANRYRTNQLQQIFMLVHTNTQWMGIGYAVSNWAPGVGTLYRYSVSTNAPLLDNWLLIPFTNAVTLTTKFGAHFDRVADGVIHLKIHAFDQFGNEYWQGLENAAATGFYQFGYPAAAHTNTLPNNGTYVVPQAGLPNSIQLEVGVLAPDTFEQLRSMPSNSPAQQLFLGRAGGNIQIFRQNIPIAGASR